MFNKEQLQRFSIRKLTVGAASVLIGVSLMTEMNNNKVYADVRTTNENSNSQVHDNSDRNTLNLSTDLKSKADEAGTADSEVTNNSNAKVGGDGVTDNSNARNVEIKNIDDSKKDQQSGDVVAPKEKTANTIQKHEENVAKGTTVDSNDLQVAKAQADLAATKINGKASSVVSPQIKQIQAKYQTSKNLPLEKQINPTYKNSDGKVVVKAEDPSNYPSELNNLIGKDKYIYQVLSLNNDDSRYPDSKLILSVNRNDSNDKNIYAYVIDNNGEIKTTDTVGVDQNKNIDINGRGYRINNDGSSNIIIDGNKESTQNSSTVTSASGYYSWGGYYQYSNLNPIKQGYGLGSTTSNDCSAIGEIIPIYTESSVIKYYYYDDNGDLQEFKDSDLSLHPNVVVTGLTGQEFKIPNVDQYKQVIRGFYLTSKDKDIPTNFTGTLSQFEEGKYYKKAYYNYDTDNVEYYSVYHQISPDGTMEVGVFDKNGNQIIAYDENGHKRPKLVEIEAGHHFTFEFQIQDQTHFLTVRNPYVTAAPHEVQFIYKKLGSIIPVDENGKHIGDPIQFKNDPNYPTKALPGIVPSISGYTPLYKHVGAKKVPTSVNDQVDPKDHPGENIEVIYRANAQTATITYIDDTTNTKLDSKAANGKFGQAITFATAPTDEIANYEKQGYVLVSNSFNNQTYAADNNNNVFYVHLKHKTESVTRNDTVTRTIHYLYDNGNTAQPDKTQTVSFDETGTKDDVTGDTTWSNDNAQTVDSVITPSITGYTPDKSSIEKQAFKFGDKDVEVTVTYNANAQTAKITYIDDTTKNNLDSKDATGKFGQAITFKTAPADEIAKYEKQGYKLVSNDFNSNKYQADNNKNVFHVHFVHDTKKVSRNDDVNMTVHYVMDDNSEAPSDNKQTVSFTENGIQDLVTQKITWTPANSQTLNNVTSPVLTGYTADIKTANGKTVNFGDPDINVTVTYYANTQTAKITYIDDTTKNNLDSKDATGKFGQAITFKTAPTDEIASYEKQGYVLVSNSFDNNKYQANNNNNVFYVHFIHGTKKVSRNDDVNMTVHYVMDDNSEAPSDSKQTVNFTENGIQDLVTQKITWTPADSQTLNDVTSPVLTGYTADIEIANGKAVNFGDPDINVTVTYHANAQTAKITYIDDTTKNTLANKDATGKFGQAITFKTAPTDEIASYEKQGYKLVSNDFNSNKYQADNNKNVFYVHFIHGTKKVSRNDDVNMTVHYVMDDNSEAPSDNKQTVNFTENGIQDLVTQKITWTPADSQTLNNVTSPVLTGYTADIKTANGKTVNFGDSDINVTVTYHANAQTATITYIDDTTKNNLDSKDATGKFGQAITFKTAPTDEIASYEKQGYKLVSNDFNSNKYQADNSKNVFHVHFVHDTKKVSRDHSASFTVHYIYKDGRQAKPDHEQTLSFTEDGIQDLVTQKITWKPADSQKFDDAITPVITGYTPDQDKVIGQTANFETGNREVTVTYLPNVQLGHINYIDNDTGKTLTRDDFSGRTNEHEDYTSIDRIQEFENKGYVFVSSDYPDGGFNFDDNDQQDQVFNVHLKHGIVTVTSKNPQIPNTPIDPDPHSPKYPEDISNTNSDVKRTIDYKYSDGKTAQPTVNDSLHFERTVVIDKVTGDVLSDTWTPSQDFNDVQTPVIQGYTPDRPVVSDTNIGHDHQNIVEHVIYNPDAQHMTITYIDDTTRKELHTDNLNGVSDQDAKYTTSDTIKKYEEQHYKLVSDSTNGKDLIFDHDDNADQTYEVHFVHGSHTINQTTSPKQTIHYAYADDLARQGKAADDNVQQLSFKRDGYNDEVTGIDHWNAWTPANSNYSAVDSPVIQGYTPDKSVIEKSTVNPTDKDTEITVVYNADKQAARVIYVDKTTNTTLTSDDLSGKSDNDSGYNTKDTIEKYQSQHYVLTSDETNGDNVIFDHDDKQNQTYYVYFVHGTQDVNHQDDVTETVDYKFENGETAQPTVTQTKHFSEDGVKDLVTGKITWTPAKPQKFDDVTTPAISGYTPDKDKVAGRTVRFGDKDIEVTVTYHNNAQKASVTYIDDKTGKTLKVDNLNGVTNAKSGYTTKAAIDTYTGLGHTLVSDDTNGNEVVFDNDDANDQAFTVHLSHGTITVTPENPGKPGEPINPGEGSANYPDGTDKTGLTDTVNRTITYVMIDGSKAPDAVHDSLSYTASKVIDKVNGEVLETKWSANQDFKDVDSPSVKGYTPDKKTVSNKNVAHDAADITETVKYSADAQKASVTYVDDKTGKTLKVDNLNGVTSAKSGYTTKAAIDTYTGLGYTLVSDDTNGNEVVFDNDDSNDQAFTVHLSHGTITVTPENPGKPGEPVDPDNPDGPKYPDGTDEYQVKRTGTQTIHYVGASDKTPADNNQTFIFTREITFDNVTGNIISVTPWNVQSHTFGNVDTPVIPGYHADKAVAGGATVTPDDLNRVITVTYAPDGNPGNPGDQPDSEISSDEHFENVKAKDKLDKTNPKKMDAYKKERKIIKTKIAKQDHTEIAEPKLPQTGEADNSIIGLLGMLLASFAAMFGFDSLHSHDKKHKN
ncbi:mucin-binding protein [Lactobacillus johnsonii]|uniref:mucin-binding protein n=1 Tax=Lactobacillus johnsonii TaxID=33959 RepID=UPI003D027DE4